VPQPLPLIVAALVVAWAIQGASPLGAQPAPLVVSVASSLTEVMGALAKNWEELGNGRVRINAAGSQTLARQIVEGARVDLFLSADAAQMDTVASAGRLVADSRVPLLTNRLVVVVARDARTRPATAADLAAAAVRRVAMGQPDSVPAGVYGRQWLERAGVWARVAPKVVPLPTVRAAFAAAREGRVDAAIVYATDARTSADVAVAFAVPEGEAPAVIYPAAVVAGGREAEARRFLRYLQGAFARQVFAAAGFGVPVAGR
jgi:molybdate transport system substrate-binding protein